MNRWKLRGEVRRCERRKFGSGLSCGAGKCGDGGERSVKVVACEQEVCVD